MTVWNRAYARFLAELGGMFFLVFLLSPPALAGWPEFRGPLGNGHARDLDLPLTWSESENVRFKVEIPGRGWSSPVVLGGQVWLTTALEEERSLRAVAVDAASGRVIHDVEVFRPPAWQSQHLENSYASPSPVLDERRVYVHFGTYGTAALDTVDGRVLWRFDGIRIDHEVGPGSSPVLWRDLLIINFDGVDRQLVAALDQATGELRWQSPRSLEVDRKGTHKKAFSTPLVVQWAGRPMLVSPGANQVNAFDPRTGEELWRVRYDGYSNVPRPVAGLGMVFVDSGYMKPHLYAIRLGGRGDVTESHVAWTYHWQVPANPSPLLIGDRLYMVNDWGKATWLDARKGEDIWLERLGGRYWASPIYAHGRIYNFSYEGETVVLRAADTFEKLAANRIDGKVRASPAVSDGAIFLRTETHLYRIEDGSAAGPTP